MFRQLAAGPSTPAGVRYYADEGLLAVVRQYHEVTPARAQAVLADLLSQCLRRWFGPPLTPADRVPTHAQDFWLAGPGRLVRLWVRFTDPHWDVIARLGEGTAGRPGHAIAVGDEHPAG
jgi:hypothetical protein